MDRKALVLIKKFVKKIQKKFKISRVIFFGSRARGNHLEHSDIDLIVVSSDFARIDFTSCARLMQEFWSARHAVDFLCYTPEEFEKLSSRITLVRDAVREGIRVI